VCKSNANPESISLACSRTLDEQFHKREEEKGAEKTILQQLHFSSHRPYATLTMKAYAPITLLFLILSQAAAFTVTTFTSSVGRSRSSASIIQLCAHPEHISQLRSEIGSRGKAFLLDVREQDEWTAGHFAEASHEPLSGLKEGKWMDSKTGKMHPGTFPINRKTGVAILLSAKIYIHCKMGGRAKQAAELLTAMGYTNVEPLAETFEELGNMDVSDIVTGESNALFD
jgi:rhodanese-related sulfurtransferase